MTSLKVYPVRPRITDEYSAHGLPLHYWGHRDGATRAAILVYVRYMRDFSCFEREPTGDELRLICEYCQYFIHAPAFVFPKEILAHLREQVVHIKMPHELTNWLEGCRMIGLWPL